MKYSQKAIEQGVQGFHITGRRWFQKSYGITYHTATIGALIGDNWVEIGKTEMHYGYGGQYLVTAGDWLIKNGWLEDAELGGYDIARWQIREALNISESVADVPRKRDL